MNKESSYKILFFVGDEVRTSVSLTRVHPFVAFVVLLKSVSVFVFNLIWKSE
jgi:hypothetical protein